MGGGKNFCGRQKKGAFHSVPGERVKSRQNRAQGWLSEESAYESCPPFLIAFLVLPPPLSMRRKMKRRMVNPHNEDPP